MHNSAFSIYEICIQTYSYQAGTGYSMQFHCWLLLILIVDGRNITPKCTTLNFKKEMLILTLRNNHIHVLYKVPIRMRTVSKSILSNKIPWPPNLGDHKHQLTCQHTAPTSLEYCFWQCMLRELWVLFIIFWFHTELSTCWLAGGTACRVVSLAYIFKRSSYLVASHCVCWPHKYHCKM